MLTLKEKLFENQTFSEEIQNLMYKKVFAKSEYFFSTKKPPKDLTKIMPISTYSKISIIQSYVFCVLILFAYFVNIFKVKSKNSGKKLILIYSLTKDQAIRNRSIKSLYTFLKTKGLTTDPKCVILIEIRKMHWTKKYKRAKTTVDIPLKIYTGNFSLTLKAKCWVYMCKRLFKMMYYLRENPNAAMVSKEFIFDQVVYLAMNSDKIDKLITTQSHIAFQPLIFEYNNFPAKKIMVWYSSNSVPIKYKREKLKRFTINRGVYANMRIDEHWVWSKKHKNYLSKYCDAKILVKKSLMLYTAEKLKPPITTIDVLVFDVTPHKNPEITQNSIYSSEEIINFINEIIICVKLLNKAHKMNFKIQLKHKRVFSKQNSSDYLNFINQKVANFEITVIDPNQNLYDLISKSKIVIGFPFASPVLIGQELNKPSIFYCSSKLLSTAQEDRKPLLIQSQTSLYKYLEKIFAVYK